MKSPSPEERRAAEKELRRELAEIVVDLQDNLAWEADGGDLWPRTPAEERRMPPLVLGGRGQGAAPEASVAPGPRPAPEPTATPQPAAHPVPQPPQPTTAADDCADLGALAAALEGCPRCKLAKTRNRIVVGEGDPNADLMLVGEAPGYHEDRQGRPFVGAAGELLDKILAAVGIRREEVYICNIIKCRPPGNRDPQPDEVGACLPFLKRQIALVDPKLILGLGRVSSQTLLGSRQSIGRLRGQFHEVEGRPFLPTYHPAALLRDASYKRPVWEDVQMLKARLDELRAGA